MQKLILAAAAVAGVVDAVVLTADKEAADLAKFKQLQWKISELGPQCESQCANWKRNVGNKMENGQFDEWKENYPYCECPGFGGAPPQDDQGLPTRSCHAQCCGGEGGDGSCMTGQSSCLLPCLDGQISEAKEAAAIDQRHANHRKGGFTLLQWKTAVETIHTLSKSIAFAKAQNAKFE